MSVSGSIGVLLPTRDAMAMLPEHLESMNSWIELADEVMVVDSFSQDGTLEFLKQKLAHRNVRFLRHPPGLYQSWNFGVSKIQSRFTYISTVGDSISRPGLEHLKNLCEEFGAEVAVSKPEFADRHGEPMASVQWPIDHICQICKVKESVALEGLALFLFAMVNCTGAILGSSASNLYRTDCLRERPFPTDFGTVGDGAWGIQHALDIRFAITRKVFSTFRHHPKSYNPSEYVVPELNLKLFELGVSRYQERRQRDAALERLCQQLRVPEVLEAIRGHLEAQRRLENIRCSRWPWSLNPAAWRARFARGRAFDRMHELTCAALTELRACGVSC